MAAKGSTFLSMAKPELSILRQLRPFFVLLSPKGSSYLDGEEMSSDKRRQAHVMREACELGPEEVHLGRLRRFDVECGGSYWSSGGFGWF